jgi:hypothetical protein
VSKSDVILRMFDQTSTRYADQVSPLPLFFRNVGRTLLAFNYSTARNHYVSGSLVEFLTAALFVLGIGYALWTWRDARSRLLLLWLAIAMFSNGFVSQYDDVTITRLYFVVPVVAIFAGVALDRMLAAWRPPQSTTGYRLFAGGAVVVVLLVSGVGNLQRWFVTTPAATPTSEATIVLRLLREPLCRDTAAPVLLLDAFNDPGIFWILQSAPDLRLPELGVGSDPANWLESIPGRCVIITRPTEP